MIAKLVAVYFVIIIVAHTHTHTQVTIIRWNKHLDKIATCDASGTVIVWRNHNGRSIMELVNNRGTAISDFQWSNDGNKVLIAYVDGYVLVGTAYGRRIWARQLNLGSFVTSPTNHSHPSRLLSSTWSPDDTRIVVGSSIGELIELDALHGGTLVSTTEVLPGIGIIGLQWVLVPRTFPLESKTAKQVATSSSSIPVLAGQLDTSTDQDKPRSSGTSVRLSLYLRNGKVVLMNSCGDQQATIIRTGLIDGKMLWSGDGAILAVSGFRKSQSLSTVRFFQPTGQLLFTLSLGTKVGFVFVVCGHFASCCLCHCFDRKALFFLKDRPNILFINGSRCFCVKNRALLGTITMYSKHSIKHSITTFCWNK